MAQQSSRHLSPDALARVFDKLPTTELKVKSDALLSQLDALSDREQEVMLAFLNPDARREDVASALTITVRTVERHLENIFAKLGTTRLDQARAAFCRMYPQAQQVLLAYHS